MLSTFPLNGDRVFALTPPALHEGRLGTMEPLLGMPGHIESGLCGCDFGLSLIFGVRRNP